MKKKVNFSLLKGRRDNIFIAESIFNYGDRTIRLLGYHAEYISGEFKLNSHDEIKWITADEFNQFDFAEADLPLVEKVLRFQ